MRALDVANLFIERHSDLGLSNSSLNKLVYYAQVKSLATTGKPLFDSRIEAGDYGPVEPEVYEAFERYGKQPIRHAAPSGHPVDADGMREAEGIVDTVAEEYKDFTAFDFLVWSQRPGTAWSNVRKQGGNPPITRQDILRSRDLEKPTAGDTLASCIESVGEEYPNTFKLLADA